MERKELFAILSLVVGIACYIPYILEIYKGSSKPHVISWFIWAMTTGIGFFAQLQENIGPGAWTLGLFCVINTCIFLYSLYVGETTIKKLDIVSLLFSLVAIALLLTTQNILYSVILVSVADSLGFYPTFYKSWYAPLSESLPFRILTIISLILSLFAMYHYSLSGTLYTITMLFREVLLVLLLWGRRKV